jgi:hypothetical protein
MNVDCEMLTLLFLLASIDDATNCLVYSVLMDNKLSFTMLTKIEYHHHAALIGYGF